MRRYHELAKDLMAQVFANKRVSRLNFTEEEFEAWLHTIDIINGLPEEQRFLGTYELSQYVIPQKFNVLLHPTRVSYSGNRQDPDLLERYVAPVSATVEVEKPMKGQSAVKVVYIDNAVAFNEMSRLIGGAISESCVSITRPGENTLASLRQRLSVQDKLYSTAVPFIPLPVLPEVAVVFGLRYMINGVADEHLVYSFGEILGNRANGGNGGSSSHDGHVPPGTKSPADDSKSVALNHHDGV